MTPAGEGSSGAPTDAGPPLGPTGPVVAADAGQPGSEPLEPPEPPECLGSALDLDGESFAVVPRMVESDFTLEAWIKTRGARTGTFDFEGRAIFDSDVIGSGNDFLSTIRDERVAFGIGGPVDVGVQGFEVVTTDEWVHVALTRNAVNGQLQIFVNGVLDGASSGSNVVPLSGQPTLAFGGASPDSHFIGSIDEVRVWNVVRSGQQISSSMRERSSGSEDGLVGYFTFEDRGRFQTADGSALGVPATLVGNPTYVASTALCPPG